MARPKKDGSPSNSSSGATTPLMQQYFSVKGRYPDAILLFRIGDFYETFGEDAVRASQALGITLTSRNNGGSDIELAGFPYHAMDLYLPRLVRAGYRVAICEQMEKPVPGKVVRRSVTEVVTPGVTTDDALLEHNTNNYLCTLAFGKNDRYGIAFLDISTGEFFAAEGDSATADKLLQSFLPAEVVLPKSRLREFNAQYGDKFYVNTLEDWIFTYDFGREKLLQHFQTNSLKGFGIEELELAQPAAGAALHYLAATENNKLAHISRLSRLQTEQYVWLDRFTIRNLELVHPNHENGRSLFQVLDHTLSPMGARLLKKWTLLPLVQPNAIRERHRVVQLLTDDAGRMDTLAGPVRRIGDLERLMSKTAVGKINPREVQQLRRALQAVDELKNHICPPGAPTPEPDTGEGALYRIGEALNPCASLRQRIERELAEEPPADLRKGNVMADGADPELDELRHIVRNSKDLLLELQQRESTRTGIPSLKIGFNNVFGYYLEVTNKYKNMVPPEWTRKQTIANGERLITEELKTLESKILGAEEKIQEREEWLFRALVDAVSTYIQPLQHNALLIARLDCLLSFAHVARKNRYVQPEIDDSLAIDIRGGRHPVIETQLPIGEPYIPNDVLLDNDSVQIILITGPNMAGKSALLRQTALIVLMAQMGSFVPADSARLGLIDKVFTRVGASDNISGGESTFMVEMNETALILNNISDRSLILLDEIGRGTSTYDGISIAWSIAEYLHDNGLARPKTLFATHYHELNELADRHERVHNFHVSTREVGQKVLFLRKLTPGGSNHSFGIHVARMAGMPPAIVERATDILQQLEKQHLTEGPTEQAGAPKVPDTRKGAKSVTTPVQLQIFETDPFTVQIKKALLALDLNTMTPMDALWKLNELRKVAEKK
ncbi:MAG: DNA mismatch repair protein MutS [Saprospiraceae bacterium]|nr:DNA mismatch repair protein MutS [Saprospiraceae bacterium]